MVKAFSGHRIKHIQIQSITSHPNKSTKAFPQVHAQIRWCEALLASTEAGANRQARSATGTPAVINATGVVQITALNRHVRCGASCTYLADATCRQVEATDNRASKDGLTDG